ncbi:MAG: bifunctional demethylmenaquinone methyltransferase/2-methoxy-6-polyprenyl-1,4-benzoquinol methylase UbiE [Planctomycetes bacterium]|nr:bifunctional demethylmenaquinone methyltransferase/2-methoxy-6-polyprenyl-1,4-benzoquinol methylase UbiE [Planctomycetota bacterium]
MPDPREVRSMFGRIAGRYDLLNRVLSAGIDSRWRRRAVRAAGELRGRRVVDVCCGTGDLSLAFAAAGADVLGIDFTPEMLRLARPKARARGLPGTFVHGDALHLPVESGVADVCSVAFGVRNLEDPERGLREMVRVLKPGGRLLVLEFSPPPKGWIGSLYRAYFLHVLPRIGAWVSGDADAYRYLPRTVGTWFTPHEFSARMQRVGLVHCGHESLSFGIASLHWGTRP